MSGVLGRTENEIIAGTPIALAEAIHAALKADDPDAEIGMFDLDDRVTIDGRFDLVRVAKRVLDYARRGDSDR